MASPSERQDTDERHGGQHAPSPAIIGGALIGSTLVGGDPPTRWDPSSLRNHSTRATPKPWTNPGLFEAVNRTSLIRIVLEMGDAPVREVQTFIGTYVSRRFRPTFTAGLVVATFELLENGFSYGSVSDPVVFELFDADHVPEIHVTNSTVPVRLTQLTARIDALAQGAEAVYLEETRRSMNPNGAKAMMGLARVAHEGRMHLSHEVSGHRVVVRARCRP